MVVIWMVVWIGKVNSNNQHSQKNVLTKTKTNLNLPSRWKYQDKKLFYPQNPLKANSWCWKKNCMEHLVFVKENWQIHITDVIFYFLN